MTHGISKEDREALEQWNIQSNTIGPYWQPDARLILAALRRAHAAYDKLAEEKAVDIETAATAIRNVDLGAYTHEYIEASRILAKACAETWGLKVKDGEGK